MAPLSPEVGEHAARTKVYETLARTANTRLTPLADGKLVPQRGVAIPPTA